MLLIKLIFFNTNDLGFHKLRYNYIYLRVSHKMNF